MAEFIAHEIKVTTPRSGNSYKPYEFMKGNPPVDYS